MPSYPLRASANGRYLVDANGDPFLLIGDSPHSILNKLNTADQTQYLQDRAARGFNILWIELLCNSYTFGVGAEGTANYGKDVNNNNPFTSTISGGLYDLTAPNSAYWSHVDTLVSEAQTNGLICFLTPLDQGGWTNTSLTNGTTRCTTYGAFLGNRYKTFPNVIWNFGNDFQEWRTAANDNVILAIADGVRSADTVNLFTTQLDYFSSNSQDDTNWISRINMNGVYTYYNTYAESYDAYNKATVKPVLFLEANYENESNFGELGTPFLLRMQEYWSILAGCLAGHFYGSFWIDRFDSAWKSHLSSQCVTELGYCKNFFSSRQWYGLVPDQSHTVLTAGFGTFENNDINFSGNDYATAAKTSDGTLAIVYTPKAHTLTVAMSQMAGQITARWYDPTNNSFTAIAGSPFVNTGTHNFTTTGNNSDGQSDWVLLLEAGSAGTVILGAPVS